MRRSRIVRRWGRPLLITVRNHQIQPIPSANCSTRILHIAPLDILLSTEVNSTFVGHRRLLLHRADIVARVQVDFIYSHTARLLNLIRFCATVKPPV